MWLAALLAGLAVPIVPLTRAPVAVALPGPPSLATGFVEDPLFFEYGSATSVPSGWFAQMHDLGATWLRIGAYWGAIAPANPPVGFSPADPADPAYDWSYLDAAVRGASAAGLHVLLTVFWPPTWALAPNAPPSASPRTWRPSPSAYGTFARAVATRYSGRFPDPLHPGATLPRVRYYQAWNEPNLPTSLEPQWTRTRHGFVPASPAIYRSLLDGLYENVKAVQPDAYVLTAGLAPYGDPPARDERMAPVTFLGSLLCLSGARLRPQPCGHPAQFDALDHHPYALTPTLPARNRADVSVPDLGRLSRVLAAAERTGRVLPRGPKPIWVTELDWDSNPPDPGAVTLAQQARYLSRALYVLWREGVSHVFWFEVRDPGFPAESLTGSGLYLSDGQPKPSATAFRFPFVALAQPHGMLTLWGRAAGPGRVAIELERGNRWRSLTYVVAGPGGVFYARRHLTGNGVVRAQSGAVVSYPWPLAKTSASGRRARARS